MRKQSGLTIVELLISITITGLLTGLIFAFFFGYWRQGITTQTELNAIVERLNASDYLRENVGSSTGLINQNSLPDPYAMRPDPEYPSGDYWQLIHAYAGLKEHNDDDVTPVVYFKRFSIDSSQNIIFNGELPYEDEYMVYLHKASQEMRVRVIANTSAPGNELETSCPPGSETCTGQSDRILATGVTGVNMRYFNRGGEEITYSEIEFTEDEDDVDPDADPPDVPETYTIYGPDFPSVEVVEFNLKLSKVPSFDRDQQIRTSTIIRVAIRNS